VVQKLFDEVWAGYDETAVAKYQTEDFCYSARRGLEQMTIINWCKNAKYATMACSALTPLNV
jgi:hypothetical protein